MALGNGVQAPDNSIEEGAEEPEYEDGTGNEDYNMEDEIELSAVEEGGEGEG